MKHTNANVTKQLTILTSVILSLIFAFAVSISFIAINNKKDVFTVCNDDEYYSETTYFLNEKEYEKYLRETGTERDGEKSAAKKAASAEQDGEIFVQAAVKKVWVAEAKDDSGNVVNSRLMKKAEIDKFEDKDYGTLATGGTEPPEFIGEDSESKYLLDISLRVLYDQYENMYLVYGYAYWEDKLVWSWDNDEAAEEYYDDYIAVTWGGKNLNGDKPSISGIYYNDKEVTFTQQQSDAYVGHLWRFKEKSGWMGKELKRAEAIVNLKREGTLTGDYTGVKLTYIHTYDEIDLKPTISLNTKLELAASVSIAAEENNWQIEISIGGLAY